MIFSIYDATGYFIGRAGCPNAKEAQINTDLMNGRGFVEGSYDSARQWFDQASGQVRDRRPMSIQVDGLRLIGVPAGSTVLVQNQAHVADGTDIELSFDHPGQYAIKVTHLPFLPFEMTITYEDTH